MMGVLKSLDSDPANILDIVQKKGPLTKNRISEITGTKLTTLNRMMHPLEESGLIVQASIGESTGGRKPALYDVNTRRYYIAGIDISRTYTQVVIVNLKMEVLSQQRFPMDETYSPGKTIDRVGEIIKSELNVLGARPEALIGAGLGAVGPLDRGKGVLVNPQNFMAEGWWNVPVKKMLEDVLGCEVTVDNGANAAVTAESLFGKGQSLKNIVYFNCGIGVRTGVVSSGRIVRAVNDIEDAFGHMVVDVDGSPCDCGNYGCIESYSSIRAIVKNYISELKKGRNSGIKKQMDQIDYIDICHAAERGEELATQIITSSAVIFGTGLANFANLLNPEIIILSGPLIQHSKLFYEISTSTALKKRYLKNGDRILFHRDGYFGELAIAVGSAALTVESHIRGRIVGEN